MLDAIDPRYAGRRLSRRGSRKPVKTIKTIPEPKAGPTLHTVRGDSRTLDQWAKAYAIPKGTLYNRVVERKMKMSDALKLGSRRTRAATTQLCQSFESDTPCRTGAANRTDDGGLDGQILSSTETRPSKKGRETRGFVVPRDGIEPPTRGFSSRRRGGENARNLKWLRLLKG